MAKRASVYQGAWQPQWYQGAWQAGDGYDLLWDQCWLYDDSETSYTDYTTEINNATADDFFTLGPGANTVDDAFYLGSDTMFDSVKVTITTPGNGNWTIVKEYWNGSTWTEFSDVITDYQTDWKSSGWSEFTFTPDADWTTTTVNGSSSLYYIRFRASGGSTMTQRPGGGKGKAKTGTGLIIADTISLADSTVADAADTIDDELILSDMPGARWNGKSLDFDGTELVDAGSDSSIKAITGSMTLEAWVKGESISSGGGSIIGTTGASGQRGFNFGPNNGGDLYWYIAENSTTSAGTYVNNLFNPDVWTHLVAVYNASAQTMEIWQNGIRIANETTGVPASQYIGNIYSVKIGNRGDYDNNAYFFGNIAEARIYNIALVQDDIEWLARHPVPSLAEIFAYTSVISSNLKLYHHYSDETLNDLSGNGNDGSHSGTPSYEQQSYDFLAEAAGISEADSLSLSDSALADAKDTIADVLSLTDVLIEIASDIIADTITLNDSPPSIASIQIADTLTLTDAVAVLASALVTDTLTLTDVPPSIASLLVADTINLIDDLTGSLDSGIVTPGTGDILVAGVGIPGTIKQPRNWNKTVTNQATPISSLSRSSAGTTFTISGVTDASAWDVSNIVKGDIAITEDGFIGPILSTGADSITVVGWWKGGMLRKGGAEPPEDGNRVTIHRKIRAKSLLLKCQDGSSNDIYIGFDENVTPDTGHPLSRTSGTVNQTLFFEAKRDRWLNISRVWAIAGTSQVLEVITDAIQDLAGDASGDLSRPNPADRLNLVDVVVSSVRDQVADTLTLSGNDVVVASASISGAGLADTLAFADNLTGVLTGDGAGVDLPDLETYDVQEGCANGLDLDEDNDLLFMADNASVLGDGCHAFVTTIPGWGYISTGSYSLALSYAPNDCVVIPGGGGNVVLVNYMNCDVFDFSTPASPSHIGTTSNYGSPYRLQAHSSGDYVYTAGSGGLSVIDVSTPASPSEIWNSAVDGGLSLGVMNDCWVQGDYLYGAGGTDDGLAVLDISNPAVPSFVGQDATLRHRRIMGWGDYLYCVKITAPRDLEIVDISDPNSPTSVSVISTTNEAYSVFVRQKGAKIYAYVGNYSGDAVNKPVMEVFDVTDPASASLIGTATFGERLIYGQYWMVVDITVNEANTIAYAGETNTDLHVVDLTAGIDQFGGDQVTKIGQPNKDDQFPNDDADDCYARQIWDLQYFDGKTYLAIGDSTRNVGPVDLYAFDDEEAFTNEQVVQDHQIETIRKMSDGMYAVGDDALVGTAGTFYFRAAGGAMVPYVNSIADAAHVHDLAYWDGDYYTSAASWSLGNLIRKSANQDFSSPSVVTYTPSEAKMAPLDSEMVFVCNGCYYRYDGVTATQTVKDMFPGVAYSVPIRVVPYGGDRVLYTTHLGHNDATVVKPLFEFDPVTGNITTHFAAGNVRDIVVRGELAYVLTAEEALGVITGRVYESSDLSSWTEVASFTSPCVPNALDIMDDTNVMYVGMGGIDYGDIESESGSIYRIHY